MKYERNNKQYFAHKISKSRRIATVIALLLLTASASLKTMAQGNSDGASQGPDVVFKFPGESPGAPFYAISANGGFIPQDGTWAAIPFHRELGCVPEDANLLQIAIPAAFGCALTVRGHEHWENGPFVDLAPRQTVAFGLGAVPIIFVEWAELQPALAGGLTLTELEELNSPITGYATFYKETDIFGISGPQGGGRGSYKISAGGFLTDELGCLDYDQPFTLHVNEVLGELNVVKITFGS